MRIYIIYNNRRICEYLSKSEVKLIVEGGNSSTFRNGRIGLFSLRLYIYMVNERCVSIVVPVIIMILLKWLLGDIFFVC